MGYQPSRLTPPQKRQYTALLKRAELAASLRLSRPDHTWTPDPRNQVYCKKCGTKSPFRMEMSKHLYLIKEWP